MNLFRRNVLIVDDNEMNRSILADILSDSYNTFEASNDFEATKQIRSLLNERLANIPIIAVTDNAFEEDRKHSC